LHRVEGDISSANYWYKRTGVDMRNNSLKEELNRLYEMTDKQKKNNSKS